MYTLRPQQELFEDAIRDAFRGNRSVLAVAATGFGKGVVLADMAFKAAEKGRDVLVVTNRRQIVLQLQEHCENAGVSAGVIMGNIERDKAAKCQVASIQTIQRRGFSDIKTPGFMLIDECVDGDTVVDTERGTVRITDAQSCRWVLSHGPNGTRYRRILRWLPRGRKKTLLLTFASGRTIRATANHKFATATGWTEASVLTIGSRVACAHVGAERQFVQDELSGTATGHEQDHRSPKNQSGSDTSSFSTTPPYANADVTNVSVSKTPAHYSRLCGFQSPLPSTADFDADTEPALFHSILSCPRWCDRRFSAPFSGIPQSAIRTPEAKPLGFTEITRLNNASGQGTSVRSSSHLAQPAELPSMMDTAASYFPGRPSAAGALSASMILYVGEGANASPESGWTASAASVLRGGSVTTEAEHVAQATSHYTLRDFPKTSTRLSANGSWPPTETSPFSTPDEATPFVGFQQQRRTQSGFPSRTTFRSVCSTSFDTLLSIMDGGERDVFDLDVEHDHCFYANGLLVHNCHQYAGEYRKLIRERFPETPVLGMTATPVGPGGAKLEHFDTVVEPIKNSEVIAAGDLLRVHPYIAPSEPDMGGIDLKRASQNEIGERVDACTIYGDVFKEWEPYKHMQTMVVLPSRATCNGFLHECLKRGISAKVVDGTTDTDERRETFSEFKATDCQMLLGIDVIREGLDLPIAQCLIDLQPTHQFRVYWQKIGRVKRPHEGQESAVIIDLAGNLWRHMVHPDQDPPWDDVTSDATIEEVIERKAGVRCPKCGSKDIYSIKGHGYKCEACQHTWQPNKPWVCPSCKQALGPNQRAIGGVCPNCNFKSGVKPVRRIRMEDGSLRTVPADEIKRRKKSKANKAQAVWDACRYKAHYCGRTLDFARVLYQKQMGEWPRNLKNCPETANSADWKRKPSDVFPWMKKGT